MKKFIMLAAASVLAILAISACGGGGDDEGSATSSPASTGSPAATSGTGSPSATGTPQPAGSPGATSSPAAGSGDFKDLTGISSYKYVINLETKGLESLTEQFPIPAGSDTLSQEYSGAYVGPDKAELHIRINNESVIDQVVIGSEQWQKVGGIVLGPAPAEQPASEIVIFPVFWDVAGSVLEGQSCNESRRETINGVSAKQCQLPESTVEGIAPSLGGLGDGGEITSATVEIWIHESEGWPVRLRTQFAGSEGDGSPFEVLLNIDVTDVGSAIDIQPPTS